MSRLGRPRLPADHDATILLYFHTHPTAGLRTQTQEPSDDFFVQLSSNSTNAFDKIAFNYCIITVRFTYKNNCCGALGSASVGGGNTHFLQGKEASHSVPMKYLRSAMRKSKYRKPPSLYLVKPVIKEISPRCSSVLSDWDADDEGFMSSGDLPPSRPLSLSIPTGPYCPRRPTLQEVLTNTASQPWTLSAFMAYLSQNHCLETLEFTMDATRYTSHYHTMVERDPRTPLSPQTQDCEFVKMLWTKLLDAYVAPNAPREVNLPSDVRNRLMSLPYEFTPPDPAELEPAVKIIYELMDESVLVPFLNSVAPARPESLGSPWTSNESMMDTYMAGSLDERSLSPARTRNQRDDIPPISGNDVVSQSYQGPSPRHSHQSHLTAALGRSASSRLSAYLSGSSSASATENPDSLTDDSTDSPSPSASALEPMTPPNTPPTSDAGFGGTGVTPGTSPQTIRPEGSSWKKMGAKLGWKKGRGSGSSSGNTRYREGSEESGSSGL